MKKLLYTETGPNGTSYKKGEWKNFAIHNELEVKGFFGEYRFLSNFWPAIIKLDGVEYASVELAYQAAKWKTESRDFFSKCTELESIDYNRNNNPDGYSVEAWDSIKLAIMGNLIEQKFNPKVNQENYQKLQNTGNIHLEEMNWWGDLFWGTNNNGEGENNLGKLLMRVR